MDWIISVETLVSSYYIVIVMPYGNFISLAEKLPMRNTALGGLTIL